MDAPNILTDSSLYHHFRGQVFRILGIFCDGDTGQAYIEYIAAQGSDAGVRKKVYLEDLDSEYPASDMRWRTRR